MSVQVAKIVIVSVMVSKIVKLIDTYAYNPMKLWTEVRANIYVNVIEITKNIFVIFF